MRVADLGLATDSYTYLAIEKGYFQEQGLEVTLEHFDTAARMVAPMSAGQLDVGRGTPSAGLFNAIARGVPLKIVADHARVIPGSADYAVALRAGLADVINSYADLKGHTLAYTGEASGNEANLDLALRQGGLTIDDVVAIDMAFPDMLPALSNGAIDGALLVEPFLTLGEQRGVLTRWRTGPDFALGQELAVLIYAPGFAEEKPALAQRFMVAYLHGLRDYYDAFFGSRQHQDEVIAVLVRYTTIKDANLWRQMAPMGVDPNGRVNVASLKAKQDWFIARGQQQTAIDLDQVVDQQYIDAARTQLGTLNP
ncbi:MAG TPA: ABC transporter substrate-binding protein [Chloroflexota bacterium]|nr:ABC transporter substrate-binding protein [Chloroflexota bacterium]